MYSREGWDTRCQPAAGPPHDVSDPFLWPDARSMRSMCMSFKSEIYQRDCSMEWERYIVNSVQLQRHGDIISWDEAFSATAQRSLGVVAHFTNHHAEG